MSRFGGFLGGSGLPDPSNFNSAAPGIYSLDEAEAFRRLGYWPLKETRDPYYSVTHFILSADGQLRDASANAAALTVVGFTRQKVDGPAGRPISAAYNSTSNAYIKPADSANLTIGTSDYTLECWVWPTGQGNNDQPLFDTRNTSGQNGTYFGFRNSDGAVFADGVYQFGTGSVQMRRWNHVSFVRENGQLSVYVNGTKQGSAVGSPLNHTSSTLVVGGYSYSPVGVNPLIGYIADARATIGAARYTGTPDLVPAAALPINSSADRDFSNVVLLLNLDGADAGTNFTDLSPSAGQFTRYGDLRTSAAQFKFGTASGLFGGSGSYLDGGPAIDLSAGSYTVETWFYAAQDAVGDNYNILGGGGQSFPNRWVLDCGVGGGNISPRVITPSNSVVQSYSVAYTLGTWVHIAWVNDAATNTFSVYVNGVRIGQGTAISLTDYGSVQVGKTSGSFSPNPYYLDDLRVTRGVLRYPVPLYTPDTEPASIVQALIPPAAPTLDDSFYGNQSIALNWRNAFNGGSDLLSFDIEYSTASNMAGGTIVNVPVSGTLPTAHTVTGLTNDTPYYLRVRANNAVGNGAYSSIVGPITPSSILPQRLIGGSPAPSGNDSYEYDVTLLLHLDGANESTTITDSSSSPSSVTAVGGAQLSTAQNKFGGSSAFFPSSSAYISLPAGLANFGLDDFTFECWLYPLSWTGNALILGSSTANSIQIGQFGTAASFGVALLGVTWLINDATLPPINTWTHLAVTRRNGTIQIWLNGVQSGSSYSSTANANFSVSATSLGGNGSNYFNGYIDDARITKNVGRFSSTFAVPTAAFPDPTAQPAYIGTSFNQDNYSESTALANKIFDNSLSNNTTNQWRTHTVSRAFGVDFGTTQEILRYRMWRNTGNEGTPTHWILQGSNTESDWTTLQNNEGQSTYGSWVNIDTRTGVNLPEVTGASPADQPYGEFAVANPGSYRYYRLFVSNVRADGPGATTNRIFLAEMQFLAVIDAPAVPTNLAAVPTSDGANLSWAYAGMLDDFDVEWADDAAFTNILGTTSSTTLVATITGLPIGTTYYARVRANNSAGTSAYTAGVSFTPAAGYSPNSDNILRFRLDDQSTAAYVQIWTTTGYAKLVSSTGETSAVAGRGLNQGGWGNGWWAAYSIAPSITGLATGTERMISVISCDASGTPSGEIEFVDFSAAPPSSGVQRINLLDISGCTALKGCLADSSTSGVGTFNPYMGMPAPTSLPSTIVEVRAVGIGNALLNTFASTNYPQWMGGVSYFHSAGLGVAGQQLSAAALNQLYTDLVQRTGGSASIVVNNNPGTAADDPTIATGKGYTVYGS
jgi:hypothetical protein